MDWAAFFILIIGKFFIIKKKPFGFLLTILSCFIFMWFFASKEIWSMVLLNAIILAQDAYGFQKWVNESNER